MSTHNEQVTPAPFEAARPASQEAPAEVAATAAAPSWVLPALLVLLVVAAMVVFWLPGRVSPPAAVATSAEPEPSASAGPGDATGKPSATAEAERTPWSDAQMAQLRKEAQDVLAELLDVQFQLQERSVEFWAGEAFTAATAAAASGDELYRQREFMAAKSSYEQGRDAMQALLEQLPAAMDTQLQLATEAIEEGDREAVTKALELAGLIEPENAQLAELQRRAELLEQLLPLLERASTAEADGDLALAEETLREAAKIDPQHQRTAQELQRVATALAAQQFNDAMSDGYAALDENRFTSARNAFTRAAKLQSGSQEAASALEEVKAAETAHRLATLKRSGSNHEQREEWQQAVQTYEKAAALDASVLFAREGLARSRSRARLDQQFQSAIDEPERLADEAVARATEALLQQAGNISPATSRLTNQINQLRELLEKANTPVTVTLQSDAQTEVIVYKVARLGRFQQERLSLRPGQYTAVGSRVGYRDVRRTFTVSHDSQPAPVVIACTDPI